MSVEDSHRRAELYLRGDTYGTYEAQQAILDRVRELEGDDGLADAAVAGEWQRIRTLDEDRRTGALETYREFRDWARENDFDLGPAFEERTRSYLGLDRVDDVVVFPIVSLAVYEDDSLQAVFPCSDEEQTYTVQNCLDAIERSDDEWFARFDGVTVERTEPHLDAALEA